MRHPLVALGMAGTFALGLAIHPRPTTSPSPATISDVSATTTERGVGTTPAPVLRCMVGNEVLVEDYAAERTGKSVMVALSVGGEEVRVTVAVPRDQLPAAETN